MRTQTLPKFQGKPLIEIPESVPQGGFLEGEFGKAVDKEVHRKYKGFNGIMNVKFKDGIVRGSTPLYVVAVNDVIRPEGLRTATPADLEKVLRTNALDLRETYVDSALVLRSEDEPNAYLARNLAEQIRARNKKINLPLTIPLAGLELTKDQNSSYGLAFKLREEAEIIDASVLSRDSLFSETDEETRLPKLESLGRGVRFLYAGVGGLRSLCLSKVSVLHSGDGGLASSIEDCRVVVISGEPSQKN